MEGEGNKTPCMGLTVLYTKVFCVNAVLEKARTTAIKPDEKQYSTGW